MSEPLDVLVIGPGAMGCLHAAMLAGSELRSALLDHRSERAAHINEHGIALEEDGEERTVPVRCSADPAELGPAGFALVFVKAYDTVAAMEHALPALAEDATVLTLQNGLGNYERISELTSPARVLAGTTTTGATLLGDGHVKVAGRGVMRFGSPSGNNRRVRAAEGLLVRGGIEHGTTHAVDDMLWAKAIMNAAINPLTALTGLRNGALVESDELREMLRAVVREATLIARKSGIFVREDIVPAVETVCEQTGDNRSSMLQDVSAGRRTEIDFINGEIARRAEKYGVDAPMCRLLTALIRGREEAGMAER